MLAFHSCRGAVAEETCSHLRFYLVTFVVSLVVALVPRLLAWKPMLPRSLGSFCPWARVSVIESLKGTGR